jgi:threonylcarbamoyladenosine tRNA methylthiotransferase MtaB
MPDYLLRFTFHVLCVKSLSYRASFYTLGCRLNQAETAIISRTFQERGYALVEFGEETDLCVINTCSVTEHSEAKCRQLIRSVLRKSPQAFIAVTGCYAQIGTESLKKIEGIDLIAGTEYKMKVAQYVQEPRKLPTPVVIHSRKISRDNFTVESVGSYEVTRANLKIQDGCDFFCTFCIIPFSRGRERSRKLNDLLREAGELVRQGHKEIVLTGVNVGRYADEGRTFLDVIKALEDVDGIKRIRITSIEPTTIPEELVDYMASSRKLCPYFHIPLQSGDDTILRAMNRRYTVKDYVQFLEYVVLKVPDVGLGTDIIVGFPGEGNAEFENTCRLLEELPFSYAHVFSYSKRPGTKAAKMDETIHPDVIKERSKILRNLSFKKRQAFYNRYVGEIVRVLFETRNEEGIFTGLTANYMRVGIITELDLSRQFRDVKIIEVLEDMALGMLV